MLKNLCKMAIFLIIATFHLNANTLIEDNSELNQNKIQVEVSMNDLVFDHDSIMVNINDSFYPIHSLERVEGQWLAAVNFGRIAGYCQQGHDLCTNCGLCHKIGCWYYVVPCWK